MHESVIELASSSLKIQHFNTTRYQFVSMKNFIIIILALGVAFGPFSNSHILVPLVSAQNISSSSTLDTKNTNGNLNSEYKTYILIFGQRTIGNVDNSTKIVSSILGHNIIKIEEEFLEEISLAPSQ